MRRLTRVSIPAVLAAMVFTAHPQPPKQDAGTSDQQQLTKEQRNQQSTFDPQRVSDSDLKKSVSDLNKASTFIGTSVENLQDEKLGSVKDLVFDPSNGKISYAVISVGGFLGVGEKLIAVPVTSLRAQPGQKYLVLNMTKNELSSAPGLARNNWPRLDDPAFGSPAPGQKQSEHGSSASASISTSKDSSSQGAPPSTSSEKQKSSDKDKDTSSSSKDSAKQESH